MYCIYQCLLKHLILDAMCIRFPFLWICCRNRYDHDNNIIEIPELRADQKKVEIVSPTQDHPNNDRMKRYQPRNGSCSEDQICEATPLVKNDKKSAFSSFFLHLTVVRLKRQGRHFFKSWILW